MNIRQMFQVSLSIVKNEDKSELMNARKRLRVALAGLVLGKARNTGQGRGRENIPALHLLVLCAGDAGVVFCDRQDVPIRLSDRPCRVILPRKCVRTETPCEQ